MSTYEVGNYAKKLGGGGGDPLHKGRWWRVAPLLLTSMRWISTHVEVGGSEAIPATSFLRMVLQSRKSKQGWSHLINHSIGVDLHSHYPLCEVGVARATPSGTLPLYGIGATLYCVSLWGWSVTIRWISTLDMVTLLLV